MFFKRSTKTYGILLQLEETMLFIAFENRTQLLPNFDLYILIMSMSRDHSKLAKKTIPLVEQSKLFLVISKSSHTMFIPLH